LADALVRVRIRACPVIVGGIGERREPHPVGEIESISTLPMALPLVNNNGVRRGHSQAGNHRMKIVFFHFAS